MGQEDSSIDALRVLAVDDHPVNREFLRAALRRKVAHLVVVASGAEAISACVDQNFDIALLDLHMPGLDGFSTWQAMTRLELPPRAIALTADPRDETRRRAESTGFRGYLEKPAAPDVLLQAMARVDRGERLFSPPGAGNGVGPLLDDEQGRRALGTQDRLDQLRDAFSSELARGLTELDALLESGAWDDAGNRVHQWIGASGYVGACRLASSARRLHDAIAGPARDRAGVRYLQFRRCAEVTLQALGAERRA